MSRLLRSRTLWSSMLAAGCVGIATLVATRGQRLERAAMADFEATRAAARVPVDRATYSPLADSTPVIASLVEVIRAEPDAEGDADRRAAALSAAHQFLLDRFVSIAGPDREQAYGALVRQEVEGGARLRQPEELRFGSKIESMYQYWVGEPPPAGATPEQIVARIMSVVDDARDRANVPTGIALDPATIGVAVGRRSLANPAWPIPPGPTNEAMLYAPAGLTHQTLWYRPDGLDAQLAASGSATVAQVQFMMEFPGGVRQPVLLNLVWSDTRGRWLVESTAIGSQARSEAEWTIWAY